jgi:NADH-quinone oxidoreductase subunit F
MEKPLTQHINPAAAPLTLGEYEKKGGYKAVHKALKEVSRDGIISMIEKSRLLGRGGAGFPTDIKWHAMSECAPGCIYLIANGDEMEPGAYKDRYLMEGNPHQLIEGMIITASAIRADKAYIFVRWAYKTAAARIRKAIAEAYEAGYLGRNILGTDYSLDLYLHTSAGRYICGEETALINSLEGKRGIPRDKPPFPSTTGLFGRPTLVNNVETLSFVSHIIMNGPEWFLGLSRSPEGGTKLFGVAGRVKNPGVWELPLGTVLREIIEEHAGGMLPGYALRGILPGGGSTDFLTAQHLDICMDFASVRAAGSRMGTGTIVILDNKTCPVKFIHNLEKFYATESCGWCTPCREGLPWVERILQAFEEGNGKMEDIDILLHHTRNLGPKKTFCAHAPGAMEPLQSGLKYFYDDFIAHIKQQKCPWADDGTN